MCLLYLSTNVVFYVGIVLFFLLLYLILLFYVRLTNQRDEKLRF
jgi:ABC-type phosphate transport system permease subunit